MKIYLDSGNVEEIEKAASSGILDGVTTNPSLIAKEGGDFKKNIKKIVKIMNKCCNGFTISVEVIDTSSVDSIVEEAREIAKIDKHVVVKIPLTKEGIKAVSILSSEEIMCNVTLCFSANQALVAAKAGAKYISPFIGRINDSGHDGMTLVEDIRDIYDNYNFRTKILAASIRSPNDVLECARIGADVVTVPYMVFEKLYYNPLTDMGLEKFKEDWNNYIKDKKDD
jgi:transaldolase